MESITSNKKGNNTINLTKSNKSLLSNRDLSVGVVHYNMETFGENYNKKSSRMSRTCWTSLY